MKLLTLFTILLGVLVSGCMAQSSHIALPVKGSKIKPGEQIIVQVDRPNSIEGSIEVGMVIGLLQCQSLPCPKPRAQLGSILFNGKFDPQIHADKPGILYENFTVTVPPFQASFGTNHAVLSTARLHLIGAGPAPVLEVNHISLEIVF